MADVQERVQGLIAALRELVRQAVSRESQTGEDLEQAGESAARVAGASSLLRSGTAVLEKLLLLFDHRAAEETPERTAELGPIAARSIADQCFVAHMELLHLVNGLDIASESENPWDLASQSNHSLGAFVKAAVSVEQAVCRHFGDRSELAQLTDARQAVALRTAYCHLRSAVAGNEPPEPDRIDTRLHACGAAISDLFASEVGPSVRIADRRQLLRLQQRIWTWIEKRPRDPADGLHVWQDLLALTELLMQINNREELIEHDKNLIINFLQDLKQAFADGGNLDPRQRLRPLLGRSTEIDYLVLKGKGETSEKLLRELGLMLDHLRRDPTASCARRDYAELESPSG